MKKLTKLVSVFLTVLIVFSVLSFNPSADSGTLRTDESESWVFSIPVKSYVTISFNEWETYGEMLMQITNSKNEIVYETEDYIRYENAKYKVTLPKGKYTITLTEIGNYEFDYEFDISYSAAVKVPAKSVKLNKKKVTLSIGDIKTLKATVTPSYCNEKIKWSSSNSKIAKVNSSGKVTAKRMGVAKITAKCGKKKATCTVTTKKVTFNMYTKKSKSLSTYVKYIKKYKTAKWTSSNNSVATVSKSGKVTAKKAGFTKVTAKIKGKKYTFNIYTYSKKSIKSKIKKVFNNTLKNPKSLIINEIEYHDDYVYVDYSAMNGFGGYNRESEFFFLEKGNVV